MIEKLPLRAAATRLGISATTLRRRIKTGEVAVETKRGRGGIEYLVIFDTPEVLTADAAQLAQLQRERDEAVVRAEQATTTLATLVEVVKTQQQQIGDLLQERATVARLQLPAATPSLPEASAEVERLRWWQRLLWWEPA